MSEPQSLTAWIGGRLLLSFLSALAGWSIASVLLLWFDVLAFLIPLPNSAQPVPIFGFLFICAIMGIFVIATWIVLLIPLALFIPCRSAFWRPNVLTIIGGVTGPIIMLLWTISDQRGTVLYYSPSPWLSLYFFYDCLLFGLPAAIIGGITGYVAAVLNRRQITPSRHFARIL